MIREAKRTDIYQFRKLWADFLEESYKSGGEALPQGETLNYLLGQWVGVVSGEYEGVALVAEYDGNLVGGLLWVGLEYPYPTRLGRVLTGWGTYVVPASRGGGIGSEMWKVAIQSAGEKKFNQIMITPMISNRKVTRALRSRGFKPFQTVLALEV